MTVVIVKKCPSYIEMVSDSQVGVGYWGNMKKASSHIIKDFSKMFKENGLVVGSSGNLEQLLKFKAFCKTNTPAGERADDIESFMLKFYEAEKAKNAEFKPYNAYLIIYKKRIWCINEYSIYEVDKYDAIGSGATYAITALYLNQTVKKAAEIAVEFAYGVGGKIDSIRVPL